MGRCLLTVVDVELVLCYSKNVIRDRWRRSLLDGMCRNRERVWCDGIQLSLITAAWVIRGCCHGYAGNEEPAEVVGTIVTRKWHEGGILCRNEANVQIDMVLLLVEDIVMATTPSQSKAHHRKHLHEDLTADIEAEV